MANLQIPMISTLILLATLCTTTSAQSDNCTDVVVSMSPCLNYGNSSAAPSAACCVQLNTVARSQPQCLCQVIDGGASTLGLTVDQSQALALPKACNVQTPDSSNCKGGGSNTGPSSPGNGSSEANSIIFSSLCATCRNEEIEYMKCRVSVQRIEESKRNCIIQDRRKFTVQQNQFYSM